jgi:hypothetical protein
LLVSLVADKSLTPQTGPERNWRDIARVPDARRVSGKASSATCATGHRARCNRSRKCRDE